MRRRAFVDNCMVKAPRVYEVVYNKRWHCQYEKVSKFKYPIIGLQTVIPLLIWGCHGKKHIGGIVVLVLIVVVVEVM